MVVPRSQTRARRLVRSVVYGVSFTAPVAVIGFLVRARWEPVLRFDEAAIREATEFTRRRPGLADALIVWQEITQPKWVYLVGTLVCLVLWRRHGLTARALWAWVTMMVAWNIALDLKYLFQRARPVVEDALVYAPGSSFPSGHAANSAAASAVLVLLLWPVLSRRGRAVAVGLAVALTIVTALNRVFLGVHYPSDVVGGVILGIALPMASYAGWRPHLPEGWTQRWGSRDSVNGAQELEA